MSPLAITLLAGVLLMLGGAASIGRQIAYERTVKTLPSAPGLVRFSMAPLSLWALYRGFELISGLHLAAWPALQLRPVADGARLVLVASVVRPPAQLVHADGALAVGAFLLLAEGAQLAWVLGEYLPAACRARLERYRGHVFRLARCAPTPAC